MFHAPYGTQKVQNVKNRKYLPNYPLILFITEKILFFTNAVVQNFRKRDF